MVTSRALYGNYLTEMTPTVTFAVTGGAVANAASIISAAQAIKQGYATGTPSGTYTGIVDKLYRVEIHVAGTGAFGSALWRWTENASVPYNDIVWNVQNFSTIDGVPSPLIDGVSWTFH